MQIDLKKNKLHQIARNWLILAVISLAIAGIFSLPPVILRGPFFADILPVELIFTTSLVLHVNLSVLCWMLCIGSMIWCLNGDSKYLTSYKISFYTACLAILLITASPFLAAPLPLKSNYVPVLQNLPFFIGISLFFVSITINAALTILKFPSFKKDYIQLGSYSAAIITLVAIFCLFIAQKLVPDINSISREEYYELTFWGSGHILQFVFTTLMLTTWLYLAQLNQVNSVNDWLVKLAFIVTILVVIPTPVYYVGIDGIYNATGHFALHMQKFPGIAPVLVTIAILFALFKTTKIKIKNKIAAISLIISFIMFTYGGILSFLISGSNAIIPAHYHGSIVGISLSFMGLVYCLLPQFGFRAANQKLAISQLLIYGLGQLCHISGLAIMGGYGALRKAPGTSENIDTMLGKALFFSGGSLAIIGGLMFVLLVIHCFFKKN